MPNKSLSLGVSSLLFASTLAIAGSPGHASAQSLNSWSGTVDVVLDGDTFEVDWDPGDEHPDGKTRIRLLGVDTNEVATNECFADEATAALEALLPVNEPVELQAQDINSESLDRPLRHVFVGSGFGRNVAIELIEDGLGLPTILDVEPDYRHEYLAAGEQAIVNQVGMWQPGSCGGSPSSWPELEMTVNYDAAGNDANNLNDEYVQIRNTGATSANVGGWSLRSSARLDGQTESIPAGTTIAPGATLRIHVGSGSATSSDLYLGHTEPWLDNEADVVYLRDTDLNLRGVQLWPCTITCGPTAAIKIEDVAYNAPGNDATNPNGERVTIRNRSAETVDLTDWRLHDDGADYSFADGEHLAAGESLEIRIGSGMNNGNVRYWGNAAGILNNSSGDQRLTITTPHSITVDCYAWGESSCTGEDVRGAIELTANFNASGNDTTNPNGEWVSLRNTSGSAVDVSGYKIFSPGRTFTFPNGTTIAANSYHRVLIGSGTNSTTKSYWGNATGILNNGGEHVDLLSPAGERLLTHSWPCDSSTTCGPDRGLVISEVNYDAEGNDATNPNGEWVKITNTSLADQDLQNWKIVVGGFQYVSIASRPMAPGESVTLFMGSGSNTTDTMYWGKSKGILLNSGSRSVQLLSPFRDVVDCHSWGSATCATQSVPAAISLSANYDAEGTDSANPNGEWINITNSSSSTVSLDGYQISTDGTTYVFPSTTAIASGNRLRVRFGNGSNTSSTLFANGQLNALSNSADEFAIQRTDLGGTTNEFSYPCGTSCQPIPDVSITEVNQDAVGSDATNPNGEWITIRNNESKAVDLRDWLIQYKTAAVRDFEGSNILNPGQELTLFIGSGTDTLTEHYWGYSSGILSNTSGDVRLWTPDRQIASDVDW